MGQRWGSNPSRPIPHILAVFSTKHQFKLAGRNSARARVEIPLRGTGLTMHVSKAAEEALSALVAVQKFEHSCAARARNARRRVQSSNRAIRASESLGNSAARRR